MASILNHLYRRKKYQSSSEITDTKLARVLNAVDLTALGIGCTLGSGIYVVSGEVAKQIAGPSVVLSFLIAAVASVLAGLCYAEFGARVPKAGSAYIYTYVTVGEFWAFIIGWNLILEYAIGGASVARGFSGYFDAIVNHTISHFFTEHTAINVPNLSPYLDLLAFGITIVITLLLCLGVKESSVINNIFTIVNIGVVIFVIIAGAIKADCNNWKIPEIELPNINGTDFGKGGFFPYGSNGMLAGAATCFYAFVGFDTIATTGEEVKNPQKSIPIGIVLSLLFCTVAYSGVSIVLTMVVPYYELDTLAPLPSIFDSVGWTVPKYIVSIGAISGLTTSLLGVMFPLPRVIYAMAKDGLLFRFLAHVTDRFKTPTLATIIAGTLSAFMAMLFDIEQLVEMMSIGTLLAYSLVEICVLILRYDNPELPAMDKTKTEDPSGAGDMPGNDKESREESTYGFCSHLFNPARKAPTYRSSAIVKICAILLVLCFVAISAIQQHLHDVETWVLAVSLSLPGAAILLFLVVVIRQPQNTHGLSFKVPLVPLLPAISVFLNVYLMLELSKVTWIRFAVWMAIGFLIYFLYGIWHSSENPNNSYEDLMENDTMVQETDIDHIPKEQPVSKETSKLIKSMFR